MRNVKVTDFKTKRINAFTGGRIEDYKIPNYPVSKHDDGMLSNSFMSQHGVYLGDYAEGWWYFKNNMVVCAEHPHGVAFVLKKSAKDYPYWDDYNETGNIKSTYLKGVYGFSHRGGCMFKRGDRIFEEKYKPKKEDYTEKEWSQFEKDYEAMIKRNVKEGWYDSQEECRKQCPISDVISFRMRGRKIIKTWEDAIMSAKNLSNYLS